MKRRILLIGGNYYPEPTGIGKYNGEMMKWLAEQGHDCTVLTTFPYYPQWKVQSPFLKRCYWFKTENILVSETHSIKVIRCPHYVPRIPMAITRLISEFSFFFTAYLVVLLLLFKKRYDYVITVAPPFEIGLLGLFYKIFRGARFLYHIQDLQVDAARDLGMIKLDTIINVFLKIEGLIIRNADSVSTISKGMSEKVKKKCKKEILLFPNWVDTEVFYPIQNKAELKRKFGFNSTDTIVLYAGAIGHKQGLEAVLHTAKILENRIDLKFAICGSGPYKENLIELKNEMNLQNVFFLPLQPYDKFNSFLNVADAHLVLQKKGAADLFLPSKLSTILAVGGVAIVTASEGTSLYDIMSSTNMGILIEPDNQTALVAAVTNFKNTECKEKGENARIYAETHLKSSKIFSDYFLEVFGDKKIRNETNVREIIVEGVESMS